MISITHLSRLLLLVLLGLLMRSGAILLQAAKDKEPPTKSIRGHVTDSQQKSIVGAKIFIKNLKQKTTTVLVTDQNGLCSIYGLDPKIDYEVHAEYGGFVSETKTVSSYLIRYDNVLNFELRDSGSAAKTEPNGASKRLVELRTFDQVKVVGDWCIPQSKGEAKFATVLLIHGFGEDRSIWKEFISDHLLRNNFAVLSIDLRGHGTSVFKGNEKLSANLGWVNDPSQFRFDIEAAVNWLKSHEQVDENRIAAVGADMGGNLSFMASGKYESIRSAVVISGNLELAQALAAGAENFQPHSILYLASRNDGQAAEWAQSFEKLTGSPARVKIFENSSAHGSKILVEIPEASGLIVEWLKQNL